MRDGTRSARAAPGRAQRPEQQPTARELPAAVPEGNRRQRTQRSGSGIDQLVKELRLALQYPEGAAF
jgi:hypothetical protein